jgi:hypothetical protein
MRKGEEVAPGAIHRVDPPLDIPADASDRRRRMALAEWIVAPENPLTARVAANRVWHYHFGTGLVGAPSDFGAMGARPTHPELLDWLAVELMENGWSLKHLHRTILLSSVYRQDSAPRPEAMRIDADSRFLWRFPPRRLEAEPIRDAILAVSGKLDMRMGGPGYHVFEPNDNYVRVYEPKAKFGPEEWRRMVYQFKPRMQQDATFGAFDCPDGAQPTPRRSNSTTPLQALNLFNSPFVVQQAEFLAERLKNEAGVEPAAQAGRAFELALNRRPHEDEIEASSRFITEHGLAAFCRALFNANEFIFMN